MTTIRVGTRGSDLALAQTRLVCHRLLERYKEIEFEEIVIKSYGDVAADQSFNGDWPAGGFVGAIEQALLDGRADVAVHSHKDIPTAETAGLTIVAVPKRAAVHDVLVSKHAVEVNDLPPGFRIGTASPRRAAQCRRLGDVIIVPIRGNVPTRLAKLETHDYDAVVLAAAGLQRLMIHPTNCVDLATDQFVPAPAQGALAIQTREHDEFAKRVAFLNDYDTRRAVDAERSFLRSVNAGCQTPVGALATVNGDDIRLRGQLFTDDQRHRVDGVVEGTDPEHLGQRLAARLVAELGERS